MVVFHLVYWRAKRQDVARAGRKPGVREQMGRPAKLVDLSYAWLGHRSWGENADITHRKMEMFARLRESGQRWYAHQLEDDNQDIGRKNDNCCDHGEYLSQEDFPCIYIRSDGQRQDDSQ